MFMFLLFLFWYGLIDFTITEQKHFIFKACFDLSFQKMFYIWDIMYSKVSNRVDEHMKFFVLRETKWRMLCIGATCFCPSKLTELKPLSCFLTAAILNWANSINLSAMTMHMYLEAESGHFLLIIIFQGFLTRITRIVILDLDLDFLLPICKRKGSVYCLTYHTCVSFSNMKTARSPQVVPDEVYYIIKITV